MRLTHFPVLGSLQTEGPVDTLHEDEYDGLPAHEPPQPVEQLAVHHVRLLPRRWEHPLQIDFLVAVGARLLLSNDAPFGIYILEMAKMYRNGLTSP